MSIIRLFDKTRENLIDCVSGETEDPLCHEVFRHLAKAHLSHEEKKCFLIAQVEIVDPYDKTKPFYSYYHAQSLNKILFRTEIKDKKRLLHRMQVLDPLTNTDIMGGC